MNPDILGWIGTVFIFVGACNLARHVKSGFLYCIAGDIFLGLQGSLLGMTSLMALNIVLLAVHVSGFKNWSKMGI